MNLDNLKTHIDKDLLLKEFTQEQIMEYYFGSYIRLNKSYQNPFRKDKFPSCRFYYTDQRVLLFNDFALGKQFSCFQIASLSRGRPMSFGDIYRDMKNIPYTEIPKPKVSFFNEKKTREETTIKVELIPFEQSDLDYWNQYNISEKVLKKFNIRKVGKAWTNGRLSYINLEQDPCYRYMEGDRIKLYRPKSKKYKFRNNYTIDIEGLDHLPERGELLVITKAMKDIMVLSTLGIPAVCPRSETKLLEPEIMNPLFERFTNIVVWYDADGVGEERSNLMFEKYKEQGLERIEHNPKLGKDISDIVKEHGILKLKDLCRQSGML